jgi:hypothetical protein
MDPVRRAKLYNFPVQPAFQKWESFGRSIFETYGEKGLVQWLSMFIPTQFHQHLFTKITIKNAS